MDDPACAHMGFSCHAGGGNIIGFSRGKTLKADKLAKYGYTTPEAVAGLVRSGKVRYAAILDQLG